MSESEGKTWWNKMWRFSFSLLHLRPSLSAGYALPLVLMIAVVLTISGTAFLGLYTGEIRIVNARSHKKKAWYYAESGLRKAIWRMSSQPLEENSLWGTFSEPHMNVSYNSSSAVLTSTGSSQWQTITTSVALDFDTPDDHIVSYTESFSTMGSGVLTYPEGKGPQKFRKTAIPDMDYYLGIAESVYGSEGSPVTQTFDSTLPDGIHFIYGNVSIKTGSSPKVYG